MAHNLKLLFLKNYDGAVGFNVVHIDVSQCWNGTQHSKIIIALGSLRAVKIAIFSSFEVSAQKVHSDSYFANLAGPRLSLLKRSS